MKKGKHLGLRITDEMHYKLKYISKYDQRSINAEVRNLILRLIAAFERKHGKIEYKE